MPPQCRDEERVVFDRGNRGRLFVGAVPLGRYLEGEGLEWILRLATLMDELDWSAFEASYKPGGRPPLHPRVMVGLIMYGLVLQQRSLRQLEALARRDVGAWWMAGGLTPDFTTFTKFIQRHSALLSDEFFVKTTAQMVRRLKLTRGDFSLDGTVIESAASTAGALKKEALIKQLEVAKSEGNTSRIEQLEKASEVLAQRAEVRERASKDASSIQVSPTEPEAVLQPAKNSYDYKLSYKPTLGAHPSGLIVGQALSASNETACVEQLLEHHERVFGAQPERVLADAGFNSVTMLRLFVDRNLDALVPGGRGTSPRAGCAGRFGRSDFTWDEATQQMLCPAHKPMSGGRSWRTDYAGRRYREYEGRTCSQCPLRQQCTTRKKRRLKVFEGDELKLAMAQVMAHPAAQRAYRQRCAVVEPAFARLRQAGLTRFRRRGERGARLEFALSCVAHNIRLLLWGRWAVFLVLTTTRRPGASCTLSSIALVLCRSDPFPRPRPPGTGCHRAISPPSLGRGGGVGWPSAKGQTEEPLRP